MNIQDALSLEKGQIIYNIKCRNADGTPHRCKITSIQITKNGKNPHILIGLKRGTREYWKINENDLVEYCKNYDVYLDSSRNLLELLQKPRLSNIPQSFIEYIERVCRINEIDGELVCSKCGGTVHIDWYQHRLECPCDEL